MQLDTKTKSHSTKRATVYLDSELHRALKVQAAETESNISELVNDAIRQALIEDKEDLIMFENRASETTVSFETLIKSLDLNDEL